MLATLTNDGVRTVAFVCFTALMIYCMGEGAGWVMRWLRNRRRQP